MTTPVAYPFNRGPGLDLDAAYAAARNGTGLIKVKLPYGEPAWLAVRYEDARLVLGDKRFSRAAQIGRDSPRGQEYQVDDGILVMDAPDHTRLRTLVAKAFTVRRVENLRPKVRALAEGLLDDAMAAGGMELVEDYALPIPVAVICELLGVPTADRPLFRRWSDAALSTSSLSAEEFGRQRMEFQAYIGELIALRRSEPADDLITALIHARDVDDRLTELEMINLCGAILIAGHETTATQIPNFVHTLLDRPEQWRGLCDDPELVSGAVEELLRYVPLGVGAEFARYATEDIEVGGTLVRAGEPVLVAIGPANRDETRFESPDSLRFERSTAGHLAFGHGIHHCLGAPLARLELQEALRALVTRTPGLRITGEIVWKTGMLVRGPRTMPVGW